MVWHPQINVNISWFVSISTKNATVKIVEEGAIPEASQWNLSVHWKHWKETQVKLLHIVIYSVKLYTDLSSDIAEPKCD